MDGISDLHIDAVVNARPGGAVVPAVQRTVPAETGGGIKLVAFCFFAAAGIVSHINTINACIRELGFAHTVLHNALHFDRYRQLGTTTPRDYASLLAQMARGTLVSKAASVEMLAILRQQHYNTMLTKDFPQYYLDCEETGAPELLWVASKSGSMNACRNDGGIVHTPYGEYVIVLMNKDFHDIIEYNDHPAIVYGARVSRMILDQVLACEGKLWLD